MPAPTLRTPRLLLEPLSMKYLSVKYVGWMNDQVVNRYLASGGDYTLEKLKDYLSGVERSDILFWAISTENQGHIGNIKIDPVDLHRGVGEYGIMMGQRSEWGKGYAGEASRVVLDYCFGEAGLRKVALGVVAENLAAVKLYEKLGFQREGVFRKHEWHDEKWCDVLRMSIFKEEMR